MELHVARLYSLQGWMRDFQYTITKEIKHKSSIWHQSYVTLIWFEVKTLIKPAHPSNTVNDEGVVRIMLLQ